MVRVALLYVQSQTSCSRSRDLHACRFAPYGAVKYGQGHSRSRSTSGSQVHAFLPRHTSSLVFIDCLDSTFMEFCKSADEDVQHSMGRYISAKSLLQHPHPLAGLMPRSRGARQMTSPRPARLARTAAQKATAPLLWNPTLFLR